MTDDTGAAAARQPPEDAARPAAAGGSFVALRSGLVIRHYVIEHVIGAGGFGITYRARHDRLKAKLFALKEFFPREYAARDGTKVVSTPEGEGIFRWGLDRFLKEAEALARCEHPGIVDVVDYFEENGTAYAVLGYVEGRQLNHWLDALGRPPTQAELDRMVGPLLDALDVVHAAKLLHRDIAPDNIMIRRDGSPCLIDFGACREDIRERSRKVSAIVKHGYSPPEQYHGIAELQGPWTDIYAVGATLYRAVSGLPPMDSSRRGALGDGLKPLGQMTEVAYRPGFMSAVDQALRLKPAERPQSVTEWRGMLMDKSAPPQGDGRDRQSLRRDDPGKSGNTDGGHAADDRSSEPVAPRRAPLYAAVAVAALAGLGAFAWWRSPEPIPRPSEPKPGQSKLVAPPRTDDPANGPIGPPIDPEQEARAAWTVLASSTDTTAIEQFLARHGGTQIAVAARQRLASLADERRKAEATEAETRRRREAEQREQAASEAWSRLASATDITAIERFLAEHSDSRAAAQARSRLAELRNADEARRRADEVAVRQRQRDAAFKACEDADDAGKIVACAPVIAGDDTPARKASAFQSRGNAARRQGNYPAAIADLTRAIGLLPGNAQLFNDRGIASYLSATDAGRAAALADYEAAIRADMRHAEALNNRAFALLEARRTVEALADANRSIAANGANAYAYDTRGQILEALGRRDEATSDYEQALRLDPNHQSSKDGLQRLQRIRK